VQSKSIRRRARPVRVTIPVGAPLKAALDTAAKAIYGPIILTSTDKKPWTAGGFRASWRKACAKARLLVLPTMTFGDGRDTARTRGMYGSGGREDPAGGIRNIVCRKADDCICRSRLLKASACAGNPDPSDLKLGLNATVTAVKQAKLDQYPYCLFCNAWACFWRFRALCQKWWSQSHRLVPWQRLVGRFHGSNHMPTKIGSLRCSCGMPG
jgi:hypothetical protein